MVLPYLAEVVVYSMGLAVVLAELADILVPCSMDQTGWLPFCSCLAMLGRQRICCHRNNIINIYSVIKYGINLVA